MFLREINPGEVYDILSSLDTSKSGDIYGITPFFLKVGASQLDNILNQIFNLSFTTGIFPDILKVAKVIPIHKGNVKDVRPSLKDCLFRVTRPTV